MFLHKAKRNQITRSFSFIGKYNFVERKTLRFLNCPIKQFYLEISLVNAFILNSQNYWLDLGEQFYLGHGKFYLGTWLGISHRLRWGMMWWSDIWSDLRHQNTVISRQNIPRTLELSLFYKQLYFYRNNDINLKSTWIVTLRIK